MLRTKPQSSGELRPLHRFCQSAGRFGSTWLDSSLSLGDRGHGSILAIEPILDIRLEPDRLVLEDAAGKRLVMPPGEVWRILDKQWSNPTRWSVGYIGYEAMLPFLGLEPVRVPDIPLLRFLIYEDSQVERMESGTAEGPPEDRPTARTEAMPTIPKSAYLDRVQRVKDHIREGDIYQANFTSRIDVRSNQDPFETYCRLRNLSPAPYSAYMNFGDYQILSSSPERMFLVDGDYVTTGPIKGTIGRGVTENETETNRQALLASEKDRAELLMIVDLERNDLGRVCRSGTVKVDSIFRPETYSSVIHLVSDISGVLRPGVGLTEVMAALLPGGSITGAPKKRAVEILNELESVPRSVYTGAIGYVHVGRADFNIAIRTMIHQNGLYQLHAGGGIVADSAPEAEYAEMLLKAGNMMRALGLEPETLAW